jgi:hypothetical protein
MKGKFEGFVKEVNSELTRVAGNTKIMTDAIPKEIDNKVSEVDCQIVANKHSDECLELRMTLVIVS